MTPRTRGAMMTPALAPDDFEEALRAHAKHYHHQHPFHRRMNDGASSREEIRGWVANRFYYQANIPRKDGAILSSCPDREVRRRWVQRIIDHDGATEGSGGIESWLRLGEAVASSLTELFASDLMADRLAAFERHYTWIDPRELAYFRSRLTQAPRDSEHGLAVVRKHCITPETQAAALAALSFKCDVLWSMLDAIDQAYGTHR